MTARITAPTRRLSTGYAHLVGFGDRNSSTLLKRKHLRNAFWSDAIQPMSQVVEWLGSPATIQALEAIFWENLDSRFSDDSAAAIDRLSHLQRSFAEK